MYVRTHVPCTLLHTFHFLSASGCQTPSRDSSSGLWTATPHAQPSLKRTLNTCTCMYGRRMHLITSVCTYVYQSYVHCMIITICCWTDIMSVRAKFQICMIWSDIRKVETTAGHWTLSDHFLDVSSAHTHSTQYTSV